MRDEDVGKCPQCGSRKWIEDNDVALAVRAVAVHDRREYSRSLERPTTETRRKLRLHLPLCGLWVDGSRGKRGRWRHVIMG